MFSLYCVCLFPTALQELKVCRTDTYVIYPKHSKFMSIIIKDLSYTPVSYTHLTLPTT